MTGSNMLVQPCPEYYEGHGPHWGVPISFPGSCWVVSLPKPSPEYPWGYLSILYCWPRSHYWAICWLVEEELTTHLVCFRTGGSKNSTLTFPPLSAVWFQFSVNMSLMVASSIKTLDHVFWFSLCVSGSLQLALRSWQSHGHPWYEITAGSNQSLPVQFKNKQSHLIFCMYVFCAYSLALPWHFYSSRRLLSCQQWSIALTLSLNYTITLLCTVVRAIKHLKYFEQI